MSDVSGAQLELEMHKFDPRLLDDPQSAFAAAAQHGLIKLGRAALACGAQPEVHQAIAGGSLPFLELTLQAGGDPANFLSAGALCRKLCEGLDANVGRARWQAIRNLIRQDHLPWVRMHEKNMATPYAQLSQCQVDSMMIASATLDRPIDSKMWKLLAQDFTSTDAPLVAACAMAASDETVIRMADLAVKPLAWSTMGAPLCRTGRPELLARVGEIGQGWEMDSLTYEEEARLDLQDLFDRFPGQLVNAAECSPALSDVIENDFPELKEMLVAQRARSAGSPRLSSRSRIGPKLGGMR